MADPKAASADSATIAPVATTIFDRVIFMSVRPLGR
jgi:hypothetical protein